MFVYILFLINAFVLGKQTGFMQQYCQLVNLCLIDRLPILLWESAIIIIIIIIIIFFFIPAVVKIPRVKN